MSHEKRYTARQAAEAVLAKTQELLEKSEMHKKYEGFKAVEESARESGARDPGAVAAAVGRKKYGKEAFQHAAAKGKKMGKAENPDEKQDAELGEEVEHLCETHMKENKAAEIKEGHKFAKSENCTLCKSALKKAEYSELYGELAKLEPMFKADEGVGSKKLGYKPSKLGAEEKEIEPSDKAYDVEPGKKDAPDPRLAEQKNPMTNPKEQAEGNNQEPGTVPSDDTKGHLKLAKFIGRMEHKRGLKKVMPNG